METYAGRRRRMAVARLAEDDAESRCACTHQQEAYARVLAVARTCVHLAMSTARLDRGKRWSGRSASPRAARSASSAGCWGRTAYVATACRDHVGARTRRSVEPCCATMLRVHGGSLQMHQFVNENARLCEQFGSEVTDLPGGRIMMPPPRPRVSRRSFS